MAAQHPVPQCARLASQTGLATSSFDDVTSSHHFNNNKSLHQTQMHAHPRPVRMHHSVDFDVWSLASDSGGSVSCDSSPSFSPFETPAASPLSTTPSIVENFKPPPTPPPSPPARYFSNEKESSFGGAIILERGALDAMHFAVDSNSQADAQKFISRTQSASETFEATPAAYARLYCDFSLLKVHMSRLEEQVRDQKQLIEELQRDNSRLKREVDVARTVPTSVLTHVARTANQSSASSNDDENLNPNVAKSGTEGNEQTSFVCKRCGMVLFHENNCISHETVAGGGRAQVVNSLSNVKHGRKTFLKFPFGSFDVQEVSCTKCALACGWKLGKSDSTTASESSQKMNVEGRFFVQAIPLTAYKARVGL